MLLGGVGSDGGAVEKRKKKIRQEKRRGRKWLCSCSALFVVSFRSFLSSLFASLSFSPFPLLNP